ncbi:MAG TPA: MG2 domain-containing protein, partial [Candidatus Krumholzibacteria bacterium]|nr:MG2 domain-containing protein [Candidatus Krumholzibacteria bacterium]
MNANASRRSRLKLLGLILLLGAVALLGAKSPSADSRQSSSGRSSVNSATANTRSTQSAAKAPADLYDEGRASFGEQRYRAALDAFETLRKNAPDWRPRESESWRLAAALRWAQESSEHGDLDTLVLEAKLFLKSEEMDRPGARVAAEIVRIQGPDADGGQIFDEAATYWESQKVSAENTAAYAELFRAALGERTRWVNPERRSLRMWHNLYRAPAPREVLFSLAETLLSGRPLRPIRYAAEQMPALYEELDTQQEIAREVLKLSPEDALAARCHLVLAVAEETVGHYEEAARQAQRAVDLGENKTADAITAREILRRLLTPELSIEGSQLYRPGSYHSLHIKWRNLRKWRLELRRVDPLQDLLPLGKWDPQSSPGFTGPRYGDDAGTVVYELDRQDGAELAAREGAGEAHVPRDTTLALAPLKIGLYWAVLQGSGFAPSVSASADTAGNADEWKPDVSHLLIQVTDLGLLAVPMSNGETEFWLTKMDGSRLNGSPELLVRRYFSMQGRELSSQESKLQLDDEGLGRIKSLSRDHYQEQIIALGELRGHPVVFNAPVYSRGPSIEQTPQWRGFILTDRPLYRPGETVHLQALLRRANLPQRKLELPKPRQVELVVRAPDGSEILHENETLDANGALETVFPLSSRPPLGAYSVQVRSGGTGLCYGAFQVDEYRLPEFRVQVQLDQEQRYVLGDSLHVKVSAEYLFGGAVQGSAEVVVRRSPYYGIWRPMPYYLQGSGDRTLRPWPGHAGGQEVLRQTLVLNEKGEAELVLPTEAPADTPNGRFEYSVEARVTDASRREESATSEVRVGAQEVYASLAPKLYVVAPGDSARVRVHVEDLMGRPAAIEGACTLWFVKSDGTREQTQESELKVGNSGEAWYDFQSKKPGRYEVHFSAQDTRGNAVEAETTVYCADPREKLLVGGGTGITLIAQEDAFLGDVARVLLVSERPDVSVHLTQSFGTETKTRVLKLRGTARLLEIPLDAAHRPYFFLRAITAWDYRFQEAQVRVEAPAPERFLKLKLDFASDDYRPGDTAKLLVKATDLEGRPVRTSFTVAVVDDAILQLRPRPELELGSILQNFPVLTLRPSTLSPQSYGSFREFADEEDAIEPFARSQRSPSSEGFAVAGSAIMRSDRAAQGVDLAEALPDSWGMAKDAAAE